ncbi:MAG: hypothetical protein V1679_02600 [Candidatus Peregrinibacteria bacterium]
MLICPQCNSLFTIFPEDDSFYKRINVPAPTLCPDCRTQRRWAHRGKNLYIRKCDKCQKRTMSWFHPDLKTATTYCGDCFYSDENDPANLARNFDFNRPFFEQFKELAKEAPRHISNTMHDENSEYIICAHNNKNCYFTDELDYCWDCYFGYNIQHCKDCVETIFIRDSEVCYNIQKGENCHFVFHSKNVFNCANSAYLANCRNCKSCLFCTNLRNKENYILNKKVSPQEFQQTWNAIFDGSRKTQQQNHKKFEDFLKTQPTPHAILVNCEDCTGDYLSNCKNVKDSFWIDNSRDVRYSSDIHYSRDCYDTNIYEGELFYESLHAGPKSYGLYFTTLCWFSNNIYYSIDLRTCNDCFGCAGIKHKQYHILNKKYTKEEYNKLKEKIIDHMKKTGEWGEFFPIEDSPHPYNLTMAQRFSPLTKEQAKQKGYSWLDEKEEIKEEAEKLIPENIKDIPKDIIEKVFTCSKTNKKFRFIPAEIRFYRQHHLPLPTTAPITRIENLWKKMPPRKLETQSCTKCKAKIQTPLKNALCTKCYSESITL